MQLDSLPLIASHGDVLAVVLQLVAYPLAGATEVAEHAVRSLAFEEGDRDEEAEVVFVLIESFEQEGVSLHRLMFAKTGVRGSREMHLSADALHHFT